MNNIDYNCYPMMNKKSYENANGFDLNQVSLEKLKELYTNKTIIWVSNIKLIRFDGKLPSGEVYHQKKIINNFIVPCKVVMFSCNYYLTSLTQDEINNLKEKTKSLMFEYLYMNKPFRNDSGKYLLDNVHVSESYEYINRYRCEEEKKLKKQEFIKWDKEKKKKVSTFSLKEAKEALSIVYGVAVSDIVIDIQ